MNSAYIKLGEVLNRTEFNTPNCLVICNVDAQPVSEAAAIRDALREQVTGTVRWTESIEYLVDKEQCELFIECGPGGVLAGLLGRIRKGVPAISISDVATLQAAVATLKAG